MLPPPFPHERAARPATSSDVAVSLASGEGGSFPPAASSRPRPAPTRPPRDHVATATLRPPARPTARLLVWEARCATTAAPRRLVSDADGTPRRSASPLVGGSTATVPPWLWLCLPTAAAAAAADTAAAIATGSWQLRGVARDGPHYPHCPSPTSPYFFLTVFPPSPTTPAGLFPRRHPTLSLVGWAPPPPSPPLACIPLRGDGAPPP